MNSSEIINFVNCLGFTKSIRISEIEHHITDNIDIIVELNTNVFVYDKKQILFRDKYSHIKNIEQLIDLVFDKTSINLNVYLRKIKVRKIKNNIK